MKDFTLSAQLKASPATCFDALTKHMNGWWSERIEGDARNEGDVFTVHFGATRKTFKVHKLVPEQEIVWVCTDSYLDLETLANKSEWTDTEIIWRLKKSESGTELHLEHIGLNPSFGCYEACEQGWLHFTNGSLRRFVETGKGEPYQG